MQRHIGIALAVVVSKHPWGVTVCSCAPLRSRCLALQDLISEVTCKEPYEWKDPTEEEWEFSPVVMSGNGAEPFKVSPKFCHHPSLGSVATQLVL